MMKVWLGSMFAVVAVAACNQATVAPKETPKSVDAETPSTAATPAATEVAMAATTDAPAATDGTGSANVLGLNLPKIDKSVANWQHGLPKPDPWPAKFDAKKDYFASMHTTKGSMTFKFFPEVAPKHVTNFIYLATVGYYDGAPFHRVCTDFMIQGGDPSGQGTGGPGYNVPAEFNPRKHVKGILSMARTPDPNGAGSQFFIMFDEAKFLDNQYTVFGQVTEGLDVVDRFEKEVAVKDPAGRCRPKSLEKIKTIDVFTKDKK